MGKSLGGVLLFLCSIYHGICEKENIIHLGEDIEYKVIVKVQEKYFYGIAGVDYTVKSGSLSMGTGKTDYKGQIQLQGKMPQASSYKIDVHTSLLGQVHSLDMQFNGNLVSGVVQFQGEMTYPQSDMSTSDDIVRANFNCKVVDKKSKSKLKAANIDFIIRLMYNKQKIDLTFNGVADDEGQINSHYLLPRVPGALIMYDAHNTKYWNALQMNEQAQDYLLNAQNKYSLTFEVDMDTGVIKYTVMGTIQDVKTTKPIAGALVQLYGQVKAYQVTLPTMSTKSGTDGKFTMTFDTPIYEKFYFDCLITMDKYTDWNQNYDQIYNLDTPVASGTKDFGLIKLEQTKGVIMLSGVITDLTKVAKFIPDANIKITIHSSLDTEFETKSDAAGKYSIKVPAAVDEKITISLTVTHADFIKKVTDPKEETLKLDKPLTLEINAEMDRERIVITIKDTLIDQTNKPVQNAAISITKSNPTILNSKFYDKPVNDKSDGTFAIQFECYKNIKYEATFLASVPSYMPTNFESPMSDCADVTIKQSQITLSKVQIALNFKGTVQDAEGKPMKDFVIDLKSDPAITLPKGDVKTDANGQWTIPNVLAFPNTQYTFDVNYKDPLGQAQKAEFKYKSTEEKQQNVQYPLIHAPSFVKATVSGTLTSPEGKVVIPIPLTITCDGKGKDGKPIVIQTTSKPDGTFTGSSDVLGENDKPISCTITSGTTPSIKPISSKISLTSPKFSQESAISVVYNTYDITIKGIATDAQKLIKGIEGVTVELDITPVDVFIPSAGGKHRMLEKMQKHLGRHHNEQLSHSVLQSKTGKDGSYTLTFKVIAGQALKFDILASHPEFQQFTKKGVAIGSTKSETLTEDIEMNRPTITTKIHSTVTDVKDKKPVANAQISILKSTPIMTGSKFYNVKVKDDDKGSFTLDFECYKNVEYTVSLDVTVPTFVTQTVESSKFKCVDPKTEINPISISLDKVVLQAIFSGKIVNPHGKPQAGLELTIKTTPETMPLTTKSAADGVWTITNNKIIPNQEYQVTISYLDGLKEPLTVTEKITVQSANQKIPFKDINYADIVDAKVTGNIQLDKGTINDPVTIDLVCPKGKNAKGPIKQEFKTDKTGAISIGFQVLAQFDIQIDCSLATKDIVVPTTESFKLGQPTFETKVIIKTKYVTSKVDISGLVTDQNKLTNIMQGVSVSVTLKPVDSLAGVLTVKTGADSKYLLSFDVVKGTKYEATLKVESQPDFQVFTATFPIDATGDKVQITKDAQLQRVIVDATISAEIDDMNKKPIPKGELWIKESLPKMTNTDFYNKHTNVDKGKFQLGIQCYSGLQTYVQMVVSNDIYKNVNLPVQQFQCGPKQVNLGQITVSFNAIQIIFTGTAVDSSGVTKFVPNSDIEIILSPPDPLVTNLKTKTDASGKYSLNVAVVQDQSYTATIKATHQDFQPYTSKPIYFVAEKASTLTQEISMDRIIIKATLTSVLDDENGKPHDGVSVKIDDLVPTVKGTEKEVIAGTTDATGKITLKLQCYQNVEDTCVFEVKGKDKDAESVKTPKLLFMCSADIKVPPMKVKLPSNTRLTIKGSVINPLGKGQTNLHIKLDSDPVTKSFDIVTDKDGKFNLLDDQLKLKIQYKLTFTYKSVTSKDIVTTIPFTTTQEISSLDIPEWDYEDYETVDIKSQFSASPNIVAALVPTTLTCDANGRDGKSISIPKQTDALGNIEFKFDILAKIHSKYTCKLTNQETTKFKSTTNQLTIEPPQFTINKNFELDLTPKFQQQINDYYQLLHIYGVSMGQQLCNNKLQEIPLSGINVELLQWNGNDYISLNVKTVTDANGLFSMKYLLLKSQLQNSMQVVLNKDQYINSKMYFAPYIYPPNEENQTEINLGSIQMTKFSGPDPCSKLL